MSKKYTIRTARFALLDVIELVTLHEHIEKSPIFPTSHHTCGCVRVNLRNASACARVCTHTFFAKKNREHFRAIKTDPIGLEASNFGFVMLRYCTRTYVSAIEIGDNFFPDMSKFFLLSPRAAIRRSKSPSSDYTKSPGGSRS